MRSVYGPLTAMLALALAAPAALAAAPSVDGYPMATPRYLTLAPVGVDFAHLQAYSDAKVTLPLWSGSIGYGSKQYNYQMVGVDPSSAGSVTVPVEIFAFKFVFSDGSVFDPSLPACTDKVSVIDRTLHSPLFEGVDIVSNGIDVGTTQYEDAFERAEFWSIVNGSGYHMLIRNLKNPVSLYTVIVPKKMGNTYAAKNCAGKFGVINANWFARSILTPLSRAWKPRNFELAFMYDVFQSGNGTIKGCCILGYHGAYGKYLQTYGTATYNDPKIFRGAVIEDISALSHEVGEWINDPSGGNATPPWGNVGQVSGCQNNLEVGDPLTGTQFGPLKLHGFAYHPQELAFFSWFYRQVPSMGTGGLYSMGGTFTAPQGPCS